MEETVYETKYLVSRVRVYKDRIEWKNLLETNVIPTNQIASIESSTPAKTTVTIETTGGKRFDIPVGSGKKKDLLQQAIRKTNTL